jgi:hypothetical protein
MPRGRPPGGVISIGIGRDVSFDQFFAQRQLKVFQYDHAVSGPPVQNPNFVFRRVAWASSDGAETRSLGGMIAENGLSDCRNMILKFDTEGAEWAAFDGIDSDTLERFRIIAAEFHGFHRLEDTNLLSRMSRVFSLINQSHIVTHVHANNSGPVQLVFGVPMPALLEISFLRRDRARFAPSAAPIPSVFDYPNAPGRPEIILTPFSA